MRLARKWFRPTPRWDLPFTEGIVICAVAVPTVALLFFMNRAMDGERERLLREVQSTRAGALEKARQRMESTLDERLHRVPKDQSLRPGLLFTAAMQSHAADGCVVLDDKGEPAFPVLTLTAERLEVEKADELLELASFDLAGAGHLPDAASLQKLTRRFSNGGLAMATMATGRSYRAMVELAALTVLAPGDPEGAKLSKHLQSVVLDYADAPVPSSQRLFMVRELQRLGITVDLPWAEAEAFSLRMASHLMKPGAPGVLAAVAFDPGVVQVAVPGTRAILYFRSDAICMEFTRAADEVLAGHGLTVQTGPHGALPADAAPLVTINAGRRMPGWELAAFGPDAAASVAERVERLTRVYRWSAIGGSLLIGLLAAWAIRRFARSARDAQVKQDFLSTVSHELKTPLTSIRMFTDTLAAGGMDDPERARTYLDFISRENERLSRLVENFLTFSRLESGRLAYDFQPVHPDEIADAAREAISARLVTRGCDFQTASDADLPLLRADAGTLTTAIINLLDNALKYSREDKRIVFHVTRDGDSVVFSVTDNGIGIDADTLRRLGEKFYRARTPHRDGREGFGLGLSIVRSIVEAHGGTLEITSQPGAGSRFAIRLPIHSP